MYAGVTIATLDEEKEDATAKDFFGVFLGPMAIPVILGMFLYKLLTKENNDT